MVEFRWWTTVSVFWQDLTRIHRSFENYTSWWLIRRKIENKSQINCVKTATYKSIPCTIICSCFHLYYIQGYLLPFISGLHFSRHKNANVHTFEEHCWVCCSRANRLSSFSKYPVRTCVWPCTDSLQWRHNGHDSVSNHQPYDCLPNRLFRRRSKKTSKIRVTGICAGNSPGTGEFPAQTASNAGNVSIWWRHHGHHFDGSLYTFQ